MTRLGFRLRTLPILVMLVGVVLGTCLRQPWSVHISAGGRSVRFVTYAPGGAVNGMATVFLKADGVFVDSDTWSISEDGDNIVQHRSSRRPLLLR
jgi:hypothetical protein